MKIVRAAAAPEPLCVEEHGRAVAASPEVRLDTRGRHYRQHRSEPAADALPAGEPGERERDQHAVRPGERGDHAEGTGRERLPAQGEGGRPGRGGERERVRVDEHECERARPAGERERASERRARQSVRDAEERREARGPASVAPTTMSQCVPPMQQQRPEREKRVLPAALLGRITGAGDDVVPVEIPREERPEAFLLGPPSGPV